MRTDDLVIEFVRFYQTYSHSCRSTYLTMLATHAWRRGLRPVPILWVQVWFFVWLVGPLAVGTGPNRRCVHHHRAIRNVPAIYHCPVWVRLIVRPLGCRSSSVVHVGRIRRRRDHWNLGSEYESFNESWHIVITTNSAHPLDTTLHNAWYILLYLEKFWSLKKIVG